jgi:protein TonB
MLSGSKWFFAFCISLIIHATLGLSFYSQWNTPQLERTAGVSLLIAETQTSILSGEINSLPDITQEEELAHPKRVKPLGKKMFEERVKKTERRPKTPEAKTSVRKNFVDEAQLKQEQHSVLSLKKDEQLEKPLTKKILPPKKEETLQKKLKKKAIKKKKKAKARAKPKKVIGSTRNYKKRKTKSKSGNQGRVKTEVSGKASLSNYKGRLRSRLMRNVRSSRISGTVFISFTIAKSGHIRGLRVYKSSGNKKLDKSALSTAKRASPFPPLPHGHKSLRVTAPIRFK